MSKLVVAITSDLPDGVRAGMDVRFATVDAPLRRIGAEAFLERCADVDAIVAAPGDPFDAALIDALPERIRRIASYSTGLDHIDVGAAARRGITVTGTPDVLTAATADTALALMLLTTRGLVPAMALVAEDRWSGWAPAQIFGRSLAGKRLGLVGGGRIASALATRALACEMTVGYWSRSASSALDILGVRHATLPDLLEGSDVVSLHVPSTTATRDMIDAAAIARMRPCAILINTARGDLVDDDAVVAALRKGRLAAAGLDVFRGEPALDPRYRDLPNAVLLPHVGSATEETRLAMGELVIASLEDCAAERERSATSA